MDIKILVLDKYGEEIGNPNWIIKKFCKDTGKIDIKNIRMTQEIYMWLVTYTREKIIIKTSANTVNYIWGKDGLKYNKFGVPNYTGIPVKFDDSIDDGVIQFIPDVDIIQNKTNRIMSDILYRMKEIQRLENEIDDLNNELKELKE